MTPFRKAKPPEPLPPALPETVDQVDAAIAGVDSERATLAAALDALPGRERQLLETDADDAAFAALDAERRRIELQQQRLDWRERRLVQRAFALAEQTRQQRWAADAEAYRAAGAAFVIAVRQAATCRAAIEEIRQQSQARGFSRGNMPLLPLPPMLPDHLQLAEFDRVLLGVTELLLPVPVAVELFSVRLKVPFRNLNAGDVAGFEAPVAVGLVERGHAEWADASAIAKARAMCVDVKETQDVR